MTNIQSIKSTYTATSTGSIDYGYYDQRARSIRSESLWSLFKDLFTDKKSSPSVEIKECEVFAYSAANTSNEGNETMKQAA